MKKLVLYFFLLFLTGYALGQSNLSLTFTAIENTSYIQLDSLRVINRTQDCDTVLYWPDTSLNLSYIGIAELQKQVARLRVFQNYPNPVKEKTVVSIYLPDNDEIVILITNVIGKTEIKNSFSLEEGIHNFQFTPGNNQLYIFTVISKYGTGSIKILCSHSLNHKYPELDYTGTGTKKSTSQQKAILIKQNFNFNPGDEILICGHYDTLESGMLDYPHTSKDYTFQFAFKIPCPGIPTVDYGGQTYNTVQIGNQCWLKENLNIGEMLTNGNAANNGIIEKYCANQNPENCDIYGGLYEWDEMMQYTTQPGARGICPEGWHIPTNEEWKILLGTTDTEFPIGDAIWDSEFIVGFDAGKNLKSDTGWYNNGNGVDLFGFTGLPGGNIDAFLTSRAYFWSSIEYDDSGAWWMMLSYSSDLPRHFYNWKYRGCSVRCIKDNTKSTPNAAFSATPYSGPAPITISFADESVNNPTSWFWDFGDGNTSTEQHPEHTYDEAGDYTVSLTASNDAGSDTEMAINFINVTVGADISPCPGIETVEYGGQVYNTVLIGTQCWLKENLNIGEMITIDNDMEDNGIIEKYCYFNMPERCDEYGGLYQWDEVMQYSTQEGAQGICPDGWHIPTDADWKILEGTVDSEYEVGHPEWDENAWRGYDVGYRLRKQNGWPSNGNNLFGFSALPGGKVNINEGFQYLGSDAHWWASTEGPSEGAYWRMLYYEYSMVNRSGYPNKLNGYSVRCIKDNNPNSPNASFSAEPTIGDAPLTVSFMDESTNNPTSWQWNFGDGTASSEQNPEHIYQNPGQYTVYFSASNEFGSDIYFQQNYIHVTSGIGTGEPCPGSETVEYGGQVYNTCLIGNQCWLKENLNIGEMINSENTMEDNQIIEKYCQYNNVDYCNSHGGLYNWNEMMQYNTQPGARGICPEGWHIPTDEEWKVLEGTVDSQFPEGDPEWDNMGYRGYDVGKNLKTSYGWQNGIGTNLYHFGALPGGYFSGLFNHLGFSGYWWTSNEYSESNANGRYLYELNDGSSRNSEPKGCSYSVRCIKDQ